MTSLSSPGGNHEEDVETVREALDINGYPDPDTEPCPVAALARLAAALDAATQERDRAVYESRFWRRLLNIPADTPLMLPAEGPAPAEAIEMGRKLIARYRPEVLAASSSAGDTDVEAAGLDPGLHDDPTNSPWEMETAADDCGGQPHTQTKDTSIEASELCAGDVISLLVMDRQEGLTREERTVVSVGEAIVLREGDREYEVAANDLCNDPKVSFRRDVRLVSRAVSPDRGAA